MRIGLFSDAYLPDINGVVSSVATLKAALEKLGHTVFVISNHKGMKKIIFSIYQASNGKRCMAIKFPVPFKSWVKTISAK